MIKNAPVLLVVGLVVIVGLFALVLRSPKPAVAPAPTVSPSPVSSTETKTVGYDEWKLFRNGYAFPLPPEWKNTSDTNGTATFAPGQEVGNIHSIAVTRLSDKKAPQGQKFTTQAELDDWYGGKLSEVGNLKKIKTLMIDGEKAVMIADTSGGKERWMVIIWARHENMNLYFTANGLGEYTLDDENAITYMVEHFLYTAPPSTGDDKKE